MDKRVVVSFAVLLFMMSFAAAELSISGINNVYSLGDDLQFSIHGVSGAPYGNLNADLVCGNVTNLLRIPANSFSPSEEVTYSVSKIVEMKDLDIDNLTEIIGDCRIDVKLNAQAVSTDLFKISNSIEVDLSLDKESYNPTDLINLRVDAVKANGELVNGFVDVSGDYSFNKGVVGGISIESFNVAPTTEGGSYKLNVTVYDTGTDGILNTGFEEISYVINQVPTSVVTSLSDVEVLPGEEISIGAEVFDQSGKPMDGFIVVRVISPDSIEKDLGVDSGEFIDLPFKTNDTAGYYSIISKFGDIVDEREVLVKEVSKVDFLINDTVLVITNVGNVIYNKTIEVKIGNDTKELELQMGVGEVRKFSLKAPSGEYTVTATDGDAFIEGLVLLTGRAISIKGVKEGGIGISLYVMWIFLILILALAAIVLLIRSRKTTVLATKNTGFREKLKRTGERFKSLGHKFPSKIHRVGDVHDQVTSGMPRSVKSGIANSLNRTNKSPAIGGFIDSHTEKDDSMIDLTRSKSTGVAESAVVMKGEKHRSAVVCLHVKNYRELGTVSKNHLIKIINKARDKKGLVDWKDDFVFVVYSPLVTKTYNNELLASQAAFGILKDLESHNGKFKHAISYNIGVHAGDLVSSKEHGKLKYTSLGNTISLAKRIAASESSLLLVSEEIKKKMMRDLKLIKHGEVGGRTVYSVSEVKNREANEAKLKDLLSRMKD